MATDPARKMAATAAAKRTGRRAKFRLTPTANAMITGA
jgi:hypothetical protein